MDEQCTDGVSGSSHEPVCATCGTAIEIESWHPILADVDAGGTLRLYPFCTPDCRDVWERNRTNR